MINPARTSPLPSPPPSEPAPSSRPAHDERVFDSGVQPSGRAVTIGPDADAAVIGRLHSARLIEIDLAGLARIVTLAQTQLTSRVWTIDGDAFVSFRGGMRPLLHHGDLHVRGSLLIDDHAWLICTGDLIVDGIISDYVPSTLAVGGNLSARRMVTNGNLTVGGNARVTEVAFARNPHTPARVGETYTARNLLHLGSNVRASSFDVERSIDVADEKDVAFYRATLSPELFAGSGAIDDDRCDRLLRCDLNLFV